jgi:hypothetical protein
VIESIIKWVLEILIGMLLKRAEKSALEAANQIKLDTERKATNDKNVKAYEEASTRADRIRASLDLLNRNS